MPILIKPLPSIDYLNERFAYDAVTGKVTRKQTRNRHRAGIEAGGVHHSGRRVINLDGKVYQTSRIAYALHYGVDPYPYEVDHDDRNVLNNSITNLILTDRVGNNNNKDHSKSKERILRINQERCKSVEITHPNGEVVVAKSIREAGELLGVDPSTITNRALGKFIGGKLKNFHIAFK
jgi:hypothetical protein